MMHSMSEKTIIVVCTDLFSGETTMKMSARTIITVSRPFFQESNHVILSKAKNPRDPSPAVGGVRMTSIPLDEGTIGVSSV